MLSIAPRDSNPYNRDSAERSGAGSNAVCYPGLSRTNPDRGCPACRNPFRAFLARRPLRRESHHRLLRRCESETDEAISNDSFIGALATLDKGDTPFMSLTKDHYVLRRHRQLTKNDKENHAPNRENVSAYLEDGPGSSTFKLRLLICSPNHEGFGHRLSAPRGRAHLANH
jgi:hypothetical protein